MRSRLLFVLLAGAFVLPGTGTLLGQALPATQPALIEIFMEDIKLGHQDDHVTTEAGWPAAFEKAKFPYTYLALASITGRSQVWYATAYESHAALGDSYKRTSDDNELAAELSRLNRMDAAHVDDIRIVHARARPDLSHGAFPDIATQRFWEITTLRLRPGFDGTFEAAAKAYGSSAARNAPNTSYRMYEVLAGLPSPTYIVFSSVAAFADLEAVTSGGEATMKGMNAEEQGAMEQLGPGLLSVETNRFRLDPAMSYVPADVRAKDPTFWTTPH